MNHRDSGAYEYLMSKLEQWNTVSATRLGNVIKIGTAVINCRVGN